RAVPALKNYVAAQARAVLQDRTARADDPQTSAAAILLGLTGQPVLYEADPRGMNIVLWNSRFYAIPANEGAFDPDRKFSRSFQADTPQKIREWVARPSALEPVDPPAAPVVPA